MNKIRIIISYTFLLILSLTFIAGKCDKPDPVPTKKELLSKVWKVKEVLIDGTRDETTDYSSHRYEFRNDNTYKIKITSGTDEGSWEFNSTEQKLILDKSTTDEQTARIVVLNETNLELEFTLPATYKTGEQIILLRLIQ